MNIGQAVAKRIEQLCREHNMSLNKLGTVSGITQSTLNNIVSGVSKNPTISTIKKVCDGFEIRIVDFFNSDLFHNLEQEVQ